ncbi:MAG: hypothetical protein JST59_29555 [Actinobacteria bacterium]|nr:hypothetical protein [Actinomycetota bacterium]
MSPATTERESPRTALNEERLGLVRIDGARYSLIWAHDAERAVSVLLDRPDQGGEKLVRLIGAFWPEEGRDVVEALGADYQERYVRRPRPERIRPRPVEPADMTPPAGRT